MRIMHLSDLHIGKRVNEFSMLEDQAYILKKIIKIIDEQHVETIIIAGDVYDKPLPSAEAVELFDEFLVSLAKRKLNVLVISGNHDSPERIAFGGRLMEASGIHMSRVYHGEVKPIKLQDEIGEINFYLLPFIKPANVRRYYPEAKIESYTDAIRIAIENMQLNLNERNILVTHQFVSGAMTSDSEELSVGGSDNVDASVFKDFDYVALGHIHRPQKCGSEYIRYSGTPLKYSFSEANHQKSVTIIDFKAKDDIELSFIPLVPKRDLVELKGTYEQLTLKSFYENTTYNEDYVHITLTDEEDIPDVISKLRVIYHNIMKLDYDNLRTRSLAKLNNIENVENKTPLEHFATFYETQNGQAMSDEQLAYMQTLIEELWENER